MPFDNTPQEAPVQFLGEIEIVDAMQEMLAARARWCQGCQVYRFRDGTTAHCLIGALRAVQSDRTGKLASRYTEAGNHVAKVMRKMAGGSIADFNDLNEHRDVLALLSRVRSHFETV